MWRSDKRLGVGSLGQRGGLSVSAQFLATLREFGSSFSVLVRTWLGDVMVLSWIAEHAREIAEHAAGIAVDTARAEGSATAVESRRRS